MILANGLQAIAKQTRRVRDACDVVAPEPNHYARWAQDLEPPMRAKSQKRRGNADHRSNAIESRLTLAYGQHIGWQQSVPGGS